MDTTLSPADAALRARILKAVQRILDTAGDRSEATLAKVNTLMAAKVELDTAEPAVVALPKAMRILAEMGL